MAWPVLPAVHTDANFGRGGDLVGALPDPYGESMRSSHDPPNTVDDRVNDDEAPTLALFTAESAQVGAALTEFVARYHDRIGVVVTSAVRGGPYQTMQRAIDAYRRAGLEFLHYLGAGWLWYYGLVAWDRVRSGLRHQARRRMLLSELCRKYGIEYVSVANVNDPDVIQKLAARDLDLFVSFQCDQIFHEPLIDTARLAVLNVHPAYLPDGRGPFPVIAAAAHDEVMTGVTVHLIVDRGIDSGDILKRSAVSVPSGRSVLYNEHVLYCAGVELLGSVLDAFAAHHLQRWPQSGGSYYSYPDKGDMRRVRVKRMRLVTLRDLKAVAYEPYEHCWRQWLRTLERDELSEAAAIRAPRAAYRGG